MDSNSAAPRTIIITIDSEIADLIPGYLDARQKEVIHLTQCLLQKDFPELAMVGHKLKGTGASYGFEALTELGARLETAGTVSDLPTCQAIVEEIASYLSAIEIRYSPLAA